MDYQHFDRLTREVARRSPRRSLFRAAAGVAAGVIAARFREQAALAQDGGLAPGAACTAATQCSQAGGATACADNGYASDGPLNCCRTAGGACFDTEYSADCCSGLYCRGGVCTDLSAAGELPPGSYCTSTSECDQASGPTVCADNGLAEDGGKNCCLMEGGACGGLSERCCAGLICAGDGRCRPLDGSTDTGGTVAAGGDCTSSTQCAGTAICADNGIGTDGAFNCCLTEVQACASDAECCAGLVCGDNYIDADGVRNCCAPVGGRCNSDAACCDFGRCIEGFCQQVAA